MRHQSTDPGQRLAIIDWSLWSTNNAVSIKNAIAPMSDCENAEAMISGYEERTLVIVSQKIRASGNERMAY